MAELESLLHEIASLDAGRDLDGLRRIREQIVAEFPDSQRRERIFNSNSVIRWAMTGS